MYQDVSLIRTHEIKLRLNDKEVALIEAFTNYTGGQKSVLARELVLSSIADLMKDTQLQQQK